MKKILIASNKKIDRKLRADIQMASEIIQYKEGILEVLELNKQIEYIVFYNDLIGQIKNDELIKEILKINQKIIIYIIVDKKKQFIDKNREIIKNRNIKILENIYDEKLNAIFEIEQKEEYTEGNNLIKCKENKNKIITIAGTSGVGKSVTTLKLSKYLESRSKKILIIDLDYINNSIKLIVGKKEKQGIIKINKKLDLIEYKINMNILETIKTNIKMYDYILIDISTEIAMELNKEILEISDKIIFLIEPNLIGIKKANTILNIYTDKWQIAKKKISIIFNKYNTYSIKYEIIKNIFSKFKILGKIKINEKYDLLINKSNLNYLIMRKDKSLYKRIIRKLNNKKCKIKGERILWN